MRISSVFVIARVEKYGVHMRWADSEQECYYMPDETLYIDMAHPMEYGSDHEIYGKASKRIEMFADFSENILSQKVPDKTWLDICKGLDISGDSELTTYISKKFAFAVSAVLRDKKLESCILKNECYVSRDVYDDFPIPMAVFCAAYHYFKAYSDWNYIWDRYEYSTTGVEEILQHSSNWYNLPRNTGDLSERLVKLGLVNCSKELASKVGVIN